MLRKKALNNNQNEIMALFHKELERRKLAKKASMGEISMSVDDEVKPEDFLVSELPTDDVHTSALDSKIESLAKDSETAKECEKCHKAHDGACAMESKADDSEMEKKQEDEKHEHEADDASYLIDSKAKYVLRELGKIAKELKLENKFAADMVEATAMDIKNDLLVEAHKKLSVISQLKKMASEAYRDGDIMSGDLIMVTVNNIKKS